MVFFFRMELPSIFLLSVSLGGLASVQEPNPFIPASPGETPKCAKKGTSYCEHVDDYPE